uniref:Ig-like domain-containing protein n=1 Tax=Catagonus wagneri TaxID=51154 RepID=A0A8C3WT28_9CETA
MVPLLLLLPLLWGGEWAGSLQEGRGYWLQVQESVTVPECLDVNVTCSFSDPWSRWYPAGQLFIYWFREGDDIRSSEPVATNDPRRAVKQETQGRFQLLGDPESNDCSLSIRDARMSDTGVYFFRVERGERSKYKYSYRDKTLKLQVTGLTEKPDIRFQEPLESGRPTNLTCSLPQVCDGGRLVRFSWAGGALDAMDPETLGSSVLTLTPRPQDHGTNLTCQVKLQGSQVTTERTILLNVSYAPWNLAIKVSLRNVTALRILQNTSSLLIFEGQAPTLRCVADGNPPAQLSWFPESPALKVTPMSSTAILKLSGVGTAPREITCQAQNPLGSRNLSLNLLVVCECGDPWGQDTRSLTGVVPGALGGAGAMALLSLSLILGEPNFPLGDHACLTLSLTPCSPLHQGSRKKPWPDSPPDQVSSAAEDAPPSGEQEEVHYASLRFQEMKSREPGNREATSTEYSEIKTSK